MRKMKIEKDANDSLSREHREEKQVIFHRPMENLVSSILNNIQQKKTKIAVTSTGVAKFENIWKLYIFTEDGLLK